MAYSRTFLVVLAFAFLAYFAVEAHWWRRVNPIMECVIVHPDGSITACFGYENFEEDDFDIDFGDDNDFEVCSRRDWRQIRRVIRPRRIPSRPGRTAFYPNCTFTVTFPKDCDCRWKLFGKIARATRNSQRCPTQDTTKPWFDKCPGTQPVAYTDAKKSTKTLTLLASAQDNNPGVTITNTLTTTTGGSLTYAFPLGTTNFNFVATDSAGNNANCPTVVTVQDNEIPIATASAPYSCKADAGKNYATVGTLKVRATATDNDPRTITYSHTGNSAAQPGQDAYGRYPIGATTMTFIARDFSGNPSLPVSTVVTVVDDEKPLITCPATATGALTALTSTSQVTIGLTGVSDNSGQVVVTVGTTTVSAPYNYIASYPLGQTSVTFTATDPSGNAQTCVTAVTVTDAIAPVITCSANINHGTDQGLQTYTATVSATATDNSGVAPTFPVTGSSVTRAFPLATPSQPVTTVTFTAVDGSNNQASCSVTVTVTDQETPIITCPAAQVVPTVTGDNYAVVNTFSAHAVDNVGVTYLKQDCDDSLDGVFNADGSADLNAGNNANCVYLVGSKTVTWTARDAAGNQGTCSSTVTVQDLEPPVFPEGSCAAIHVFTEPSLPDAAVTTAVAAIDNSHGTITYKHQIGSGAVVDGSSLNERFPAGQTSVVFIAKDEAGNTAQCTVVVTVQDNQPPELSLAEPPAQGNNGLSIIKNVEPGQTSVSVDLAVFASDNVGVVQAGITGITEGVSFVAPFVSYTAVVPAGQTREYLFFAADAAAQRKELSVSITATASDPCVPNPCVHGSCQALTAPSYLCTCDAGWYGPTCGTPLVCEMSQPFTVSACPLDEPVVVTFACTPQDWVRTWTAISGPADYDLGPLNAYLATQQGSSINAPKNTMTPEGQYVFECTSVWGITSFTRRTTVTKLNGATPSIRITGVGMDGTVSRNTPLPLVAELTFPSGSCLVTEPYKRTWEILYQPDNVAPIDVTNCNGDASHPAPVLAMETTTCTIPKHTFQLSMWDGVDMENPTYLDQPYYYYTFKACASPIADIAAHAVCAETTIKRVLGSKVTARISGYRRILNPEVGPGYRQFAITSNQLDYNGRPWLYSGTEIDQTLVTFGLSSDVDTYFTAEDNFYDWTDFGHTHPYRGTEDPNEMPEGLQYEWDCQSAYYWMRCFAGFLPPKCCSLQAGAARLGFQNRNDQPKLMVPYETISAYQPFIDEEDWSYYAIRLRVWPYGHPELQGTTQVILRPLNNGDQIFDVRAPLCSVQADLTSEWWDYVAFPNRWLDDYHPEFTTVDEAYIGCFAPYGNESIPYGPDVYPQQTRPGMQVQATVATTITWAEANGKLDLSQFDNSMGLRVDPSKLVAGTEYKFCYTQTAPNGQKNTGCTRYKYDPKPPACAGTCFTVSPTAGTALNTKFTLKVEGFTTKTTTPLRYVFKYVAPGSPFEIPLSDMILTTSVSAVLPAGSITLVVYAYDESNMYTRKTIKVEVAKPEGSAQCAALDTVKTLLAEAEKAADANTAVDLITAITFFFRSAPAALSCNGVDQTQQIAEARARFLHLLDLFSAAASRSSSRANQWANALSGVSAMYRSGAVMTPEERRTALAVVDRIITGMNTLTATADSYLAGFNVMSIISDLAGTGDCALVEDLKTRITSVQKLVLKNTLPANGVFATNQPNVEVHVQRVQTNRVQVIKTKFTQPVTVSIPISVLRPTESFVDVAIVSFTAPALRSCRATSAKTSSFFSTEAVEKTGLQGTLVSNAVEVDIFSVNLGTRMQLEGLDEPILVKVSSGSDCNNAGSVCGAWSDSVWSGTGCTVAAADSSSVTCACSRLTEVGVISTGDSCNAFNAGYAVVFAAYGVGALVTAAVMGVFFVRKASHLNTKLVVFGVIAVMAICRLISGLYFAGAGGSQGLTDVVLAIPFGLYFFVNTQLFERVRQASSSTALPASKLTGLFKLYYGFFTLGLGALIVAAFYSGSTHNVIAVSTTRVLAGASMLAALLFGVNGILARPVGPSPDVSLFRTYLLSSFCVLVGSLIWVALATDALTAGLLLPVDLIWGLAIANLYRRDGEVKSAAPKAASGETVASV